MELNQLIPFVLLSLLFIAIPGPNILVIASTSLLAGKIRGLQTVIGTSLAMSVQLLVAAIGTSWLLSQLATGLMWLKWFGVAYLFFLGISALFRFFNRTKSKPPSAISSLQRGFWVSLTNPKTILFFSAFLPQFVSSDASYLQQITILSIAFWVMATLIDASYALLAARARWLFASHNIDRVQNGVSGSLYLAASGILAGSNRF